MSGVLNRALEGLRRLVQRDNRLEEPKDVMRAKQRKSAPTSQPRRVNRFFAQPPFSPAESKTSLR